jgi:hypothetical protein
LTMRIGTDKAACELMSSIHYWVLARAGALSQHPLLITEFSG